MTTAEQDAAPLVREERRSRWITSLVLVALFVFAIATIVACTLFAKGSTP